MEDNIDINKIFESNNDSEEFEFEYNFINTPWDDRSNKSKAGIVALLLAIFIATMACVVNNLVIHYRGFEEKKNTNQSEMNCIRVKLDEYLYVARINSVSSNELLCVGVVVSPSSILANGVCVKSGPIRVHIGSTTNPHCKKGFAVDVIKPVNNETIVTKTLVLLSSREDMTKCTHVIQIGNSLIWDSKVHIIGRPLRVGRTLSRQVVTLAKKNMKTGLKNTDKMICVKDLAFCPVGVGDLLVQNGRVFGLAATSVPAIGPNRIACFVDLNIIRSQLKEFDSTITY